MILHWVHFIILTEWSEKEKHNRVAKVNGQSLLQITNANIQTDQCVNVMQMNVNVLNNFFRIRE